MSAQPLTDDEFLELLQEPDPFKLAIRGHAAIEAEIDAAIVKSVEGRPADDLLRLPFRTRLKLAVALGVVLPDHALSIEKLAKLRNEFAHGDIHSLSVQRAHGLAQSFSSFVPPDLRPGLMDPKTPRDILARVLMVARALIRLTSQAFHFFRQEQARIYATHKATEERRNVLADALARPVTPTPELSAGIRDQVF